MKIRSDNKSHFSALESSLTLVSFSVKFVTKLIYTFHIFALSLLFVSADFVEAQVRIIQAIPSKSFGWLPLFVAQDKGFYRAEGLQVEVVVMKIPVAVTGLISGETHFATANSGMRAAIQGAPVKAVVFYYDRSTWLFMVRPEIRLPADLRGKNIAIRSYGTSEDFTTRKVMRAQGVSDKDYTLVPLGEDPQKILALVQGQVHAALLNPDSAAIAQARIGGLKRLASIGDLEKTPFSGFAASDKFLTEGRQVVKRFLRASVRATVLTREQPQEAARVAEKSLGMDGKVALVAVQNVLGAISSKDPGGFTEAGMREWIVENAEAVNRKPEEIKITHVADLTLLREVQEEMGIICEGGYGCKK